MVIDLLSETAGAPGSIALEGDGASWTYAELEELVGARADELRAEGVEGGRLVPMTADATVESVLELLALWRVGATPAPLNSRLTRTERYAAEHAMAGERSEAQVVLWTSGTTGTPRGVAYAYRHLAASAHAAQIRLGLGPEDVWLASLSPAHIGGLALVTRALLLGSRLVAAGPFQADQALRRIDGAPTSTRSEPGASTAPITHLSVVPTQLRRLVDLRGNRPPPATFRCALVGGARAPADLVKRALGAGWPVALTYGLSEATSQVATAPPALTAQKPGTVGEPLDGVEVRIAEDGELLIRGATVADGYIGADAPALLSEDGWLHTGDLGRIDQDGHLWITGRRVDRIVTGGVTVDALEVEEALRSYGGVADACVVGVPDSEWGERVAAWVVPAHDSLDQEALRTFLADRLSSAKRPRLIHVSGDLPRNANGKVDRRAVGESLTAL